MKKQLILLIYSALIFISCDTTQTTITEIGVIKGTITYTNILNDSKPVNGSVIVVIEGVLASNGLAFIDTVDIGASFEIGPLPYGEYKLSFDFVDTDTGIIYKAVEQGLILNSDQDTQAINIALTPQDQTVIVANVMNNSQMPVADAVVYLYNDPDFLKTYFGAGAFVDSARTNNFGKASFIDQAPGNYYILPFLYVGADTLSRDTTNLVPTQVLENSVTEIIEMIK